MIRPLRRMSPLALSMLLTACAGVPRQPPLAAIPVAARAPAVEPTTPVPNMDTVLPAPTASVWDALRGSFAMADCNADPAVLDWARRYTRNPAQFEASLRDAMPRLVYVQQVAAQYHVAGEFVLLPWVESHFQAVHAHKRRAAGMWQIMPITARTMGLRVDDHYDGRLDMPASAHAVMKLLRKYQDQFHDWRVTDYAYNAGEFSVRSVVRKHGLPADQPVIPDRFGSRTTREHLVKLLAMACVVREPERFQVSLPVLPEAEHLVKAPLPDSMPMTQAAAYAGMSVAALKGLNPAFDGDAIDADAASYLMLPARHAKQFQAALQADAGMDSTRISAGDAVQAAPEREHKTHTVRAGESLWQIARDHSTNVGQLQRLNHLRGPAIRPGEVLQIDDVD